VPITTVSLHADIKPVIAVVLGTIVLREPFGVRIAVRRRARGHRDGQEH
jgi:hypothetical protein